MHKRINDLNAPRQALFRRAEYVFGLIDRPFFRTMVQISRHFVSFFGHNQGCLMSLAKEIAPHLQYLRRFARA